MTENDETTRRAASRTEGQLDAHALALTVLGHADAGRVGDVFVAAGNRIELARNEPAFVSPETAAAAPLGDAFVSRRPLVLRALPGDRIEVVRGEHGSELVVDGEPLGERLVVSRGAVSRGVVIELAERVVLLLHLRAPLPSACAPQLGLVGASEAVDELRASILLVAPVDSTVLVRGESGVGKELVARAIVGASARRHQPFVALNVAALPSTLAASELFGHRKGSFTGAVRDHAGAFERAHEGTLFLDEIGDALPEVQAMMLRVLEAREVQPIGAGAPRAVDVRVIAATDADLEEDVESGAFRSALLHRLAGFRVLVPPLRARRDDVGRLLVAFLRDELGRLDRLGALATDRADPWLPSALVARFARAPWPGNVRELHNAVRQIAIRFRDEPRVPLTAALEMLPELAPRRTPVAAAASAVTRRKPSGIGEAELVRSLEENGFRLGRVATQLGISRSSLYDRIDRSPLLRKARDVSREELERALEDASGDVARAAEVLRVSPRGIVIRMKEVGLRAEPT